MLGEIIPKLSTNITHLTLCSSPIKNFGTYQLDFSNLLAQVWPELVTINFEISPFIEIPREILDIAPRLRTCALDFLHGSNDESNNNHSLPFPDILDFLSPYLTHIQFADFTKYLFLPSVLRGEFHLNFPLLEELVGLPFKVLPESCTPKLTKYEGFPVDLRFCHSLKDIGLFKCEHSEPRPPMILSPDCRLTTLRCRLAELEKFTRDWPRACWQDVTELEVRGFFVSRENFEEWRDYEATVPTVGFEPIGVFHHLKSLTFYRGEPMFLNPPKNLSSMPSNLTNQVEMEISMYPTLSPFFQNSKITVRSYDSRTFEFKKFVVCKKRPQPQVQDYLDRKKCRFGSQNKEENDYDYEADYHFQDGMPLKFKDIGWL